MNGSVLFEGNPLLSGSLNVNSGGHIEPLEIEINENGTRTITPPSGVDGYAPITIDTVVPQIAPILETLNVTQNGRYEPPEGVAGFDGVNVNVAQYVPVIEQLDYPITANGTYHIAKPENVDGFYPVNITVNVPSGVAVNTVAKNLNIGGSVYTTVDYNEGVIEVGKTYLIAIKDGTYTSYVTFNVDRLPYNLTIPLDVGSGSCNVYENQINLYNYSGDYRDIYVTITEIPDAMKVTI